MANSGRFLFDFKKGNRFVTVTFLADGYVFRKLLCFITYRVTRIAGNLRGWDIWL